MRSVKRTVCLLAVILSAAWLSLLTPANDMDTQFPEKVTYYLGNNDTAYYFDITDLTANLNYKKVKSSKPSVAWVSDVINMEGDEYYKGNQYRGTTTSGRIYLSPKKAGTTTVSFKMSGATYKVKTVFKDYVNPLKRFVIPGIEDGRNVAGIFRKRSVSKRLSAPKKNKKTGKIEVQAADGWKITSLSVNDASYFSHGVKSCSVRLSSPIGPYDYVVIIIETVNIRNGGTIKLACYIGDGN